MHRVCTSALLAIAVSSGSARAEDGISRNANAEHEQTDQDGTRALLFGIEMSVLLGGGAVWYWTTGEDQKVDWTYPGWKMKLTSLDAIRFDTNSFGTNAFGHTEQSIVGYSIARGNGLGLLGAAAVNAGASVAWEYLVEYREYPSLNDLIVNTVSGPALGEPLYRVGEYFRSGPKTTANKVLAFLFSPFEDIERRVDHRSWRTSARPWHRFRLSAGAVSVTVAGDQRTDATAGVDLEVASFDRSGVHNGWTPAGGWSRIAGEVRFGGDGIKGARIHSRTSYGGYQSRAVFEDGLGRSAFLGVGTGLTYESSMLGMERDQFAAYHLLGPQLDIHLRTSALDLRWQTAVYADFGIVHAFALGDMPVVDTTPPFEDALARWGYYFGAGGTGSTRLLLRHARWSLDVEAHAHQLWSLDQRDSGRGEPEGRKGLADSRLYGRGAIGYALDPGGLLLEGTFDLADRRGTVDDLDRRSSERRYGLQLTMLR